MKRFSSGESSLPAALPNTFIWFNNIALCRRGCSGSTIVKEHMHWRSWTKGRRSSSSRCLSRNFFCIFGFGNFIVRVCATSYGSVNKSDLFAIWCDLSQPKFDLVFDSSNFCISSIWFMQSSTDHLCARAFFITVRFEYIIFQWWISVTICSGASVTLCDVFQLLSRIECALRRRH